MIRRARREATVVPGASLRGLVFDACFDNRIPNTFGMLRHFGMPNRNRVLVSESSDLNTAALADALRISESEVLLRRYPAQGRGHRLFFGLHIMKSRIEDGVRRFSPAAIAAGKLHHPATHELRDLPFSTVGWDMLLDACPCETDGVRQNWVRVNGSSRCHSCGGSLGKIPAVQVRSELRPSLEFIAQLVDPDPLVQNAALEMLPQSIREAGRTLLYDFVMNAARVISGDADSADFHSRCAALARASCALIKWPAGIEDIDQSADCPTYVLDWVRRTYSILDAGDVSNPSSSSLPTGNVTELVYLPSGAKGRVYTEKLNAMAAARLCGVDEQALKEAWDDAKLTQHFWIYGSRRVRAFDPAELMHVAPTLRVEGSRAMAASYLGLPLYGLEQLLEQRIFSPAPPGPEMKQGEVHMEAARALVAEIERAASIVEDPSMSFLEAVRHVSGRPKPWGAAIATLLSRQIPFALGSGSKRNGIVGRIIIPRDAKSVIMSLSDTEPPKLEIARAARWTGADALECLNGNRSATDLLEGLEFTGAKKRLFAVTDVLARAAAGVTTFDLSRRWGRGTTQVVDILKANRVRQIAPGLWIRGHAEELTLGRSERE